MKMPRDEVMGAVDDLLREVFDTYLRPRVARTRELNVTLGQMHCLHTISRLGNPTMSEVAKALGLHPSTVTVLVDGLVAHGLVRRQADPEDRRIVRVAETAKGARDRQRHMAEMRSRVTGLLSALSDDELDRLYESMRTLRDAARQQLEAAGRRGRRGPGGGQAQ